VAYVAICHDAAYRPLFAQLKERPDVETFPKVQKLSMTAGLHRENMLNKPHSSNKHFSKNALLLL